MFTFAEKLKQMSNIEHKDVGVSSLKGTPSKKIYIKTSTEAVYNPEGVTQEYINNHVDGSKIVDGTVTTGKIADNAVTMGKLDNDVQTKIQQGTQRAWTPKGNYSMLATYDANDLVYYPTTNSSYISLYADNKGHVPETSESMSAWWMKVLDGSYVNVMVDELEQAIAQAIEDAQEDIDNAIAGANTAAQAANTAAANADAKIDWVKEQVDSLTAYEVAPELDETSIIPVQNKVVTEAINDVDQRTYYSYEELVVDTSSMKTSAMSLGSNKTWLNQNSSSHVVIPCLAGDVFNIKVSYSAGDGGFRGWLTSAYVPPTRNYSPTPYVSGQDRVWHFTSAGEQTITAPKGAAYLCLCTRDGSGKNCTWVGKRVRATTLKDEVINTIEPAVQTNTQDIAALKVKPSFVPSSYLPIKETHERLMGVSGTQGGALYQDIFVFFYGVNGNRIRIYDLNAKQLIQTIMLPEFSNTRTHGNTLSFGSAFYDANDDFPLLYICSGYTDTTSVSTSEVYVIRIAGESGSYTVSLVQTITLDFGITNGWTEFVVDPILNRAWIKGSGIASYICVALPSTSSSTATIGTSTTIIDKFNVPAFLLGTTSSSSGQGWYFYHNRIYYVSGVPQSSGQGEYSTYICVVNTLTHVIETVLPLVNFGLTSGTSYNYEPECCFIWNDEFYVVFPSFIEKLIF